VIRAAQRVATCSYSCRSAKAAPAPGKSVDRLEALSWGTARQITVSRPNTRTTTRTRRRQSAPWTLVPSNPVNGPSTTRTCCPIRGWGAAPRFSCHSSSCSSRPAGLRLGTTPQPPPAKVILQRRGATQYDGGFLLFRLRVPYSASSGTCGMDDQLIAKWPSPMHSSIRLADVGLPV
jgi:hypothetical protein